MKFTSASLTNLIILTALLANLSQSMFSRRPSFFGSKKQKSQHKEISVHTQPLKKEQSLSDHLACLQDIAEQFPSAATIKNVLEREDKQYLLVNVITTTIAIKNLQKRQNCNTPRYRAHFQTLQNFSEIQECVINVDLELTLNIKVLERKCSEIFSLDSAYLKNFKDLMNCEVPLTDLVSQFKIYEQIRHHCKSLEWFDPKKQ